MMTNIPIILSFHYSIIGFANIYLVANQNTKEAIIIDPASFGQGILKFIEDGGYYIKAVLLTHNHQQHITGLNTLLRIYDANVYSSNSMIGNISCITVKDNETFTVCGLPVTPISIPGHSSDSVAYQIQKLIFTGDSLLSGLIGSTSSQHSKRLLKEQLAKKILTFPDDAMIFPGHGPPSSVRAEKLYNTGWTKSAKKQSDF